MRKIILAAALLTLSAPAHAGDRLCQGKIVVSKEWTTVDEDGCRFKTNSKIGRQILAVCPDGSICSFDSELSTKVDHPMTKPYLKTWSGLPPAAADW
jgi:hypothetical protein